MIQNSGGQFYVGIVEDRADPLMLGRVRARVVGLHTHDKIVLPTEDLPWAMIMQPVTGVTGASITPPTEGTTVIIIFNDWPENQQPIVIGILSGIPQETTTNIDKYEEPPLFRDDITPAGRPIPVTSAEVDANHIGPVVAPNAKLNAIVDKSQTTASTSQYGLVQTFLGRTATSAGAVGGLLGSIGGVGSTYGTAKNSFENLLLGSGNINSALGRFKIMATQSGPLGSGIVSVLNGKASLKSLLTTSGLSIGNIQNSFNSIKNVSLKNPSDFFGLITNAQQIAGQIASIATTGSGTLGGVAGEASQVTLQGTGQALLGNLSSFSSAIFGELGGIFSGGLSQIQNVASFFGLGNITGGLQSGIGNIRGTLEDPNAVGVVLTGPYSSKRSADIDAGNITVTQKKEIEDLDSKDFSRTKEGSTPPVNGVFGGPNYGGASPTIEPPVVDMNRYEGGSKSSIATTPPPDWNGDRAKAEEGIKTLLRAADKYGLKTNEQKAALLGIVGGECGWIPQAESAQYSRPDRLLEIFSATFKGNRALAEQYCNWEKGKKGSKADFFNFVYDPANNGRQLGNSQPGDGGKFYGRGFIQLTGRSNYERFARLSGHPLVENPDLLNNNPDVSAEIAVLYFMELVKGVVPTAHPQYFYAAKSAVGNNSKDIAERKLSYYEYFYGTRTQEGYGYGDKQAGSAQNPYSFHGSLAGNEAGKPSTQGFSDPHSKYPLKRYTSEQETNRLARGVVKETVVPLKESKRTIGVPIAMKGNTFSQPSIPYGAKYPFNKVTETESGHVQEFDDTPGYERIHTYHRSGTFEEIDANGTKVTKIVGDGYVILDRNGFISIAGEANVTVNGNVNIYCRSDANIEVAGSAEMKIGGNFDIGVARDMNVAVEGNFSLWANGAMNLQSRKKGHIMTTEENMYITSNKELHVQSLENMYITSKKEMHLLSSLDMFAESLTNMHVSAQNYYATIGESWNTTADTAFITTDGAQHYLAGGNINMDAGPNVYMNSNTAIGGEIGLPATPSIKALVHGMVPPPLGVPINPIIENLTSPPTLGEEKYMYELPVDGRTVASQAYIAEKKAQDGKSNTYESEKATPQAPLSDVKPTPKREEILAMTNFTADFRLSQHFTLGMLFDDGFNVRHKLINQNGLTRQQIVANLSMLCENVLEKYLEFMPGGIQGHGKKWRVTSGYRMGEKHGDHGLGRAVDIAIFGGKETKKTHFDLIQKLDKAVPYDQMILEYEGDLSWIHTSIQTGTFGGGTNRKMAFTMNNHATYGPGFILLG